MDGKILARLGAFAFVGVAITAMAIGKSRKDEAPQVQSLAPDRHAETEAFHQLLRRCRDIGEAATRDPACLKAWADNRERFLGSPASSAETTPQAQTQFRPSLNSSPANAER